MIFKILLSMKKFVGSSKLIYNKLRTVDFRVHLPLKCQVGLAAGASLAGETTLPQ